MDDEVKKSNAVSTSKCSSSVLCAGYISSAGKQLNKAVGKIKLNFKMR